MIALTEELPISFTSVTLKRVISNFDWTVAIFPNKHPNKNIIVYCNQYHKVHILKQIGPLVSKYKPELKRAFNFRMLIIFESQQFKYEVMDTPPSNSGITRPSFMHYRRADQEDDHPKNNEMMIKFGPKYQLYKKELPMPSERQNIVKIMNEMKKQSSFLDNTKWMFENNNLLHSDNYSANPL